MYKTVLAAGLVSAILIVAAPASAQTATPDTGWFVGAMGGVAAVQNVGGLGGAQVGRRLSPRIEVFAEGVYLQDVVTRRRQQEAESLATYLATTQGNTASATLKVPAGTFSGGVRVFLNGSTSFRIYAVGSAGVARATKQPEFILGGANVTTSLSQYGVTLGSDLTGTTTVAVVGGGLGVEKPFGAWYVDANLRLYSLQLDGEAANATTVAFGFGRTF